MFKKCLKYDLKSIWNVWWIIAVCVLGVGMVGCVCLRVFIEQSVRNSAFITTAPGIIVQVLLMITFVLAVFAVSAFLAVTPILVFIRFYRNFFTDEGYLTFTLPVSRRTLYLSKTLSALIWSAASFAVVALLVLFGMLVIPPTGMPEAEIGDPGVFMPGLTPKIAGPFNFVAYQFVGWLMKEIWAAAGGWTIVYLLEALTGLALFALFEMGLIQMCITIGSVIAKRHKLIASIGIYFGVTGAVSSAGSLLFVLSEFTMLPGLDYVIRDDLPVARAFPLAAVLLLSLLTVGAILCCVIHFIALGNVERRLNLA